MPEVNPSIFKAYDIRGIYPSEISEEAVYLIAKGFATLLCRENPGKKLKVAAGMDMRLSSPALKKELLRGLLESGLDVEDLGLVSTPTFYFAVANYGYDGGVQVSASHNPKEWNGLKLVRRGAESLSKESGIMDIKDIVASGAFLAAAAPGGLGSREGVLAAEVELEVPADAKIKPLKVALDAANAMGALDLAALFAKLPCETFKLNFVLDGSFPAHEADPVKPENLKELQAAVLENHADLGIATDGDGDRIAMVDEKGDIVPLHVLKAVLAAIELKEIPGALIAYDIRPGKIIKDIIAELGGKPLLTPVGSSLIKEMMLKEGAVFGGESSGHFFYKMPFGTFEAPLLVVYKILKLLSEENKSFSEILAPYSRYAHSGEMNFHLPDRAAVAAKIEAIKTAYAGGDLLFVDGVSVETPDFWFNVRASNTEPILRVTVEAKDAEILAREVAKLKQLLGVG